jgi:adenine-specific DNA methylase
MNYPKRLIEVDLPIKQISAHARREKSIRHGHISTLHIWWARRPLAACRAVLCAALWPDPADENCPLAFRTAAAQILFEFAKKVRTDITLSNLCVRHFEYWRRFDPAILKGDWQFCPVMRYYLLDFIADFANWDASTNPVFLETARELTKAAHESLGGVPGTYPLVVDPFAGGGSIPLEALRVGAGSFASDLNPVAVLLNRVILDYIPKYGQELADEVRKWGDWVKEQADKELAEFYPKDPNGDTPIAYLWARTITCEGPGCGTEIPLMRSFWLTKNRNWSVALKIVPKPNENIIDFKIVEGAELSDLGEGTVRRGSANCPLCGYTTPVASVRRQLQKRRGAAADARLFAVITSPKGGQGHSYRLPTEQDRIAANKAREILEKYRNEPHNLIPYEPTPVGGGSGAGRAFSQRNYGMDQFDTLFSPRQLLALITVTRILQDKEKLPLKSSGIDLAVRVCLALMLDRCADYWSSLCSWHPGRDIITHTFARQSLSMVWDYAEANPFSGASGNLRGALEWICKVCETRGVSNAVNSQVIISSATNHPLSDGVAQVFATDPPYYDAVPYADLSDFFYIWLKRVLGDQLPDLFRNEVTPKDDECVVDEVKGHDKAYFEKMMGLAMAEGCRLLAPEGVCLVVFAHKSTSGWEAQLKAMIEAGWTITGSWPIDTEMEARLRAQDSAALASSIHLVCRPRKNPDGSMRTNYIGDWRDILQELPKRIHEWMPRLAAEGIVGADAIFSCLGPALEIFSQYSSVERADGSPVTLQEYLEYVWAAVSREALNTIFQGADTSGFEPDARLTATWLWTLSAGGEAHKGNGKAQKQANGTDTSDEEGDEDEDEEQAESGPKPGLNGYGMEYDTARKLAQGLGVHLEKEDALVEIKGSVARLRSLRERARFLFQKNVDDLGVSRPQKKARIQQQSLFSLPALAGDTDEAVEVGELPAFTVGTTTLDRVHQAMLLYASGRTDALKYFLKEDGAGTDPRFWKLALALSSLYPRQSDERRWAEGIQSQKKSLGF